VHYVPWMWRPVADPAPAVAAAAKGLRKKRDHLIEQNLDDFDLNRYRTPPFPLL